MSLPAEVCQIKQAGSRELARLLIMLMLILLMMMMQILMMMLMMMLMLMVMIRLPIFWFRESNVPITPFNVTAAVVFAAEFNNMKN